MSSVTENDPAWSPHLRQAVVLVVVVVVVQLCVSDGVEDLMESLTVESEKTLSSQEPDSHQNAGPAADHLQGEDCRPESDMMQIAAETLDDAEDDQTTTVTAHLSHRSLSIFPVSPSSVSLVPSVSPQIPTLELVRTCRGVRASLRLCSRSSL